MEMRKYISQRIKEEREKLLMPKYKLAQKTGITYQFISKIEKGCNFSIDALEKICKALGLKLIIIREEKFDN